MDNNIRVRALTTLGDREIQGLGEVLIDCVEGGASVSFMLPMTREKAEAYWTSLSSSLTRGDRAVIVAEDAQGILCTELRAMARRAPLPHDGLLQGADPLKARPFSRLLHLQQVAHRWQAGTDGNFSRRQALATPEMRCTNTNDSL